MSYHFYIKKNLVLTRVKNASLDQPQLGERGERKPLLAFKPPGKGGGKRKEREKTQKSLLSTSLKKRGRKKGKVPISLVKRKRKGGTGPTHNRPG